MRGLRLNLLQDPGTSTTTIVVYHRFIASSHRVIILPAQQFHLSFEDAAGIIMLLLIHTRG
jgi:hypothetical protein